MSEHDYDHRIEHDVREIVHDVRELVEDIFHPHPHHHRFITGFTEITTMVPLAAGQTATFSTTALPAGTAPDPAQITWSSSDTTNAPIVVNPNDASGLSAQVTFPSTTPTGLTFILTINYINPDGNAVSQANSFVTVAPPPLDITGFTEIVQSA